MASRGGVRRAAIGGLVTLSCGIPFAVKAQVIPDQTLGPENSQVFSTEIDGRTTEMIREGAVRGDWVLHSFEQFSIPAETEAIFQTDPANQVNSALFTQSEGSGQAGDLRIETESLIVSDGGELTVSGTDTGNAGQLLVNANQILLEITASGVFGLQVITRQELEQLVGEDLSEFDPSQLPSNDILAISQTDPNLSGEVIFNSPDVDPSGQLVLVSEAPVDVADLVATICNPGGIGSTFLVLGRGGLASTPIDLQQRSTVWQDLRPLKAEAIQIGADPDPIVVETGIEPDHLQATLVITCWE